jgi:Pregnancy-associated plasma protein-A
MNSTSTMLDLAAKRSALVKCALCLALGFYSFGLMVYTLSNWFAGEAACTHCFKGEAAFAGGKGPNGEASSPTNRYVNVAYVGGSGPNSFAGNDASKISNAINTAAAAWNNTVGEDGTSRIPYTVQQTRSASKVNVTIGLVDRVPGKNPDACGGIDVVLDSSGNVKEAVMVLKRDIFNGLTQDQVAKVIEHELGHFFGLENIGDSSTGQCDSIMDKANDAKCTVKNNISKGDVSTVNKHVNNNNNCDRKRKGGLNPLGGSRIEPPIPNYYPMICYYYILEVPHYSEGRYLYSDYYLEDVLCTY